MSGMSDMHTCATSGYPITQAGCDVPVSEAILSVLCVQDAVEDVQNGYARVQGVLTGPVRLAQAALQKGTSAVALLSRSQEEPPQAEAQDN